jgi:hypothetical protein
MAENYSLQECETIQCDIKLTNNLKKFTRLHLHDRRCLHTEDGNTMYIQNVCKFLPNCMSHSRKE